MLQWGRDQLIAEIRLLAGTVITLIQLQWGRDQLIAEINAQGTQLYIIGELQWGRDQLIAEMRGSAFTSRLPYVCFNGAAIN